MLKIDKQQLEDASVNRSHRNLPKKNRISKCLVWVDLKLQGFIRKNSRIISNLKSKRSCSNQGLFNHITSGQIQSDETVPLIRPFVFRVLLNFLTAAHVHTVQKAAPRLTAIFQFRFILTVRITCWSMSISGLGEQRYGEKADMKAYSTNCVLLP